MEVALVLPVLCLLVIGGWVAGYMAFAKMALAMAANRAARDFAAEVALHGRLAEPDRAYRFDGGFAESFGLPRWAVHALIMRTKAGPGNGPSDQAVVVAMCYRLPLTLPGGTAAPLRQAEAASGAEETRFGLPENALQAHPSVWREIEEEADGVGGAAAQGGSPDRARRAAAGEAGWAADLWRQAIEGPPADFTPVDAPDPEGPDGLGAGGPPAVRAARRGRAALIVTARSAYLLQTVFRTVREAGPMKRILAETKGSVPWRRRSRCPWCCSSPWAASPSAWLHHKTWLQVLVSETARERAADADLDRLLQGHPRQPDTPRSRPGAGRRAPVQLPPARRPALRRGRAPCAAPAGLVPTPPVHAPPDAVRAPPEEGGWLGPVRALRRHLSQWLKRLERLAGQAEAHLDAAVALGEQAVWYRRVADNLAGATRTWRGRPVTALAGAAVEEVCPFRAGRRAPARRCWRRRR